MSALHLDATRLRSYSGAATASREEYLLGERCKSSDPLRRSGWDGADLESLERDGVAAETIWTMGEWNQPIYASKFGANSHLNP